MGAHDAARQAITRLQDARYAVGGGQRVRDLGHANVVVPAGIVAGHGAELTANLHGSIVDRVKAHIRAHPGRAKATGWVLGGLTVLALPHAALAGGVAQLVGHGVAFNCAMASTVAVGAQSGQLGADLVLNGRDSDLIDIIGRDRFSDETIRGLQAAALAGPAAATMVLAPGVGLLALTHTVGSTAMGGAVIAGAGTAGVSTGIVAGRRAANEPLALEN